MANVFISYSRKDKDYVSKLADWLKGHGVTVWFDHYIDYGEKWELEIKNQLDSSAAMLIVMSKAAQHSTWVLKEIKHAKRKAIPVYPLLLEIDGIIDAVAELQLENVSVRQMPGLQLCQRLPGFLVSEQDIANALTPSQRKLAERIILLTQGLTSGSKGPAVAALQVELLRVGLDPGPINGIFGRKTFRAVREFQARRSNEPLADGMVGPRTWMILINSSLGDLAPG